MISRTYIKLTRYFIGLIITTCVGATLLFVFTVGLPLADNIHRLLRKQVLYIANLTEDVLGRGETDPALSAFLKTASDSYEFDMVLFDAKLAVIAAAVPGSSGNYHIESRMLKDIAEKGLFVQPGHFGKPTIYVLPLLSGSRYLYLTKHYPMMKPYLYLGLGLVAICILLILAIYPLSKSFTRPITQLTHALSAISDGIFSKETGHIENRKDELGELLRAFQQMNQSVEQMMESKKQLLADISHELQSPLGRLRVATELIREDMGNGKAVKYIENMNDEIEFMSELIRALSIYSKINLTNFRLKKEAISPEKLINDVYNRYLPIISRSGFEFNKRIEGPLAPVMIDPHLVTQVLNNLLDNAVRYCRAGGIISIGVSQHTGKTHFFVADTGVGIAQDMQEKIFEPLFRIDPSRNRDTGGAGLGLAISHKIAELHGGKIGVEHADGVTTFRFWI